MIDTVLYFVNNYIVDDYIRYTNTIFFFVNDLLSRFRPIRFVLDVLFVVASEVTKVNVKALAKGKCHSCLSVEIKKQTEN